MRCASWCALPKTHHGPCHGRGWVASREIPEEEPDVAPEPKFVPCKGPPHPTLQHVRCARCKGTGREP
jgi:hypothetical protein